MLTDKIAYLFNLTLSLDNNRRMAQFLTVASSISLYFTDYIAVPIKKVLYYGIF